MIANVTCRLCLLQKDSLINLSTILLDKIKLALNIKMNSKNHWPQGICHICDEFLERIINYRDSVEQNQSILLNKLGEMELKVEIQDEEIDFKDDINSDSDYEPLKEDKRKTNSEKVVKVKGKRGRPKKNLETTPNNQKEKKARAIINHQYNASIEEMDEVIRSFMPLKCDLCEEDGFESLLTVYNHTKSEHKDYKRAFRIRCGLCKNVYDTRSKYYRHILYHQNPDNFKCDQCDKSFRNQANLDLHKTMHLPEEDKSLECNVCHHRFKLERQLKMHLKIHIPQNERKFKCELCFRAYVNPSQLKEHFLISHSKAKPFVCEVCAKGFPLHSILKYHIKITHKAVNQPKVRCNLCSKVFANNTLLRRHIKVIHEESGSFECNECGHISPNSKALKDHKRRQHEPKTKTYSCKFCEKVLKSLIGLREHESTHTGASLYTCKFCPKEFNSNANKYKHQKEKHPDEWSEWQKQRMNLAE